MTIIRAFRRWLLLESTLLAGPVYAQARPPAPADAVTPDADIVVTGARLQAVREIAAKREIAVISDSISADEIGTLPDFGLGEALQRVPGVSAIQNNARGEAQFLSIRGLNADYNMVQIDGVSLPANEINRRNVSLDVIPSSLASRVEVYKTRTAAMDGNAIGGTANLRTRSAFDGEGGPFVGGRADIGTYDYKQSRRNSGPSGQAELVVSDTFGPDDKFGFVVSGSYFRRNSASLNSATDNYLYFDPATGARLNQLTQDVSKANAVPDRRRWLHYDNVRERYGVFAKLEFDDHAGFKAALTAADFRHHNDEERQSNIVILSGTPTNVNRTSGSVAVANGQVDLAEFDQKRRIRYVDGHAELQATDRLVFDGGVNLAVATYRQDARLATYRIANTSSLAYAYTFDPGSFATFNLANPGFAAAPANYRQFEFGTNSDDNREEALTGYGNVTWNSAAEDRGFGFAAGYRVRFVDRRYDFAESNYLPKATSNFLLSSVASPTTITTYNGGSTPILLVDPTAAQAFFNANSSGFTLNATNAVRNQASDFGLSEDTYAGYVQAHVATDSIRGDAGVRYEATDLVTRSSRGIARAGVTTFTPVQSSQSYGYWLPSASLDWDLGRSLRVRAAYNRSLGRPNYSDLAERETVSDTLGIRSITRGNPALTPRIADNFDLSIEYYANRDTLFSAALFRKVIRDEIITTANQTTEQINGVSTIVTTTQPINAGTAKVNGIELNAVVARMAFLPGPLAGFGASANVTLLDAAPLSVAMNGNPATRRQLSALVESADVVANAKLFYTIGPVTAQIAYNHTSPLLFSVSTTDALQDRRLTASDVIDAQLRFMFSRNLTVVVQGKNLTDERPQRVFGPGFGLLREELNNGASYFVGALFKL